MPTSVQRMRTTAGATRRVALTALSSSNRWRLELLALQKLVDLKSAPIGARQRAVDSLVTRLLRIMEREPASVVPVARELRKIDRKHDALEVVDRLWENKAQSSAEWALACAVFWYEDYTMWRGDLAIHQAAGLAPQWADIFEEQARNRSFRNHMALAVQAAQRVIELRRSPNSTRYWSEFIGTELFKGGQREEALEYLERGLPENPDWRYWYRRAVCCEETGRPVEAAEYYDRAGELRLPETPLELRTAALHYFQHAIPKVVTALEFSRADSGVPWTEPDRLVLLSQALLRLERPKEAVVHLRARDRAIESADLARIAALAEELAGNQATAIDEYRQAIDRHGLPLHHRLVRVLRELGRVEEAVEAWAETIELDDLDDLDDEVDPNFASDLARAKTALHKNDSEAALLVLKRLAGCASSTDNVRRVQRTLGSILHQLGETEAALRAFTRGSGDLAPHPSESEAQFAPLGDYERYAAACDVLPVEPDIVLYEAFQGAQTSCNPLALCQHLLRERPDLHHVWAIREGVAIHRSLRNHPKVSFVRIQSEGYRLHLATAGSLINNNSFLKYFIRREGQRYLNTWHGVPWKTLGRDTVNDPYGYGNLARNMLQATHLAFPDQHTKQVMLDREDVGALSTAQLIVGGQARVDQTLTMDAQSKSDLRKRIGVEAERRVVLYAPTWRGGLHTVDSSIEPYVRAISALIKIPQTTVLLRVHHLMASKLNHQALPKNVIVVPAEIDTNELLAIVDVLVSDYSSVIFDFAPLGRPILKFVFDHASYAAERGLYFGLDDVPGLNCSNEDELGRAAARAVLQSEPCDWSTSATAPAWLGDDGNTARRITNALFSDLPEPRVEDQDVGGGVLISTAGINPNGITRALRSLLASDLRPLGNVQLMIYRGAVANPLNEDVAAELHESACFTLTEHQRSSTRRENLAWARLQSADQPITDGILEILRGRMQRERRRYFGETQFASVVDFDGYNLHQSALAALGFPSETKKIYVLHAEFESERRLKYPYLSAVGRLLGNFDVLGSVSSPTSQLNSQDLEHEFGVPAELHTTIQNMLDVGGIRRQSENPLDADLGRWFETSGHHVIVVGRLSIEKNHSSLLDALDKVIREGNESLKLTVLGDGPRMPHLVQQARDLKIMNRVFFAGYRANPYPAIKAADALILPSLHEGQALVLLEAMTLGTDVVASNAPAPSSALEHGALGMLVAPDVDGLSDGLQAIADDMLHAAGSFDAYAYQARAQRTFLDAVGIRRESTARVADVDARTSEGDTWRS